MAYIISKRMYDAVCEIGVDAEGRTKILNANMQVSMLTGYSEEKLKTMDVFELFSADSVASLQEERDFDEDLDLNELFRRFPKQTLLTAQGSEVPAELKIFALPPSKGFVANYEIIMRDKTLIHLLADRMRENRESSQADVIHPATEFYTGSAAEDALATICRYATERKETPVTIGLVRVGFAKNSLLGPVRPGDMQNLLSAVAIEMQNFIRAEDLPLFFTKNMLRDCGAAPAAKQCPDGVFCVALISCDVVQAQRCFERLRIGVSNADSVKNVAYPLSGELNMSIGCASAAFDADVGFSSSHMLFNAGEALCAAMHLGGDRVALSNNSGEVLLRYVAEAKGQPVSMPAPEKKSSVFKLFSRSVGR